MNLKEYLVEHLSGTITPMIKENRADDVFDYSTMKVKLIDIAEPAINFFKDNLEDEFFKPVKSLSEDAGILEYCPWTEWGWKAFTGEDGNGGTYAEHFKDDVELLTDHFEWLLKENGLEREALASPEAKDEKSNDNSNKKEGGDEEEKEEEEPKGEGKKLSELGDEDKKKIALMMLDGEAPRVGKAESEEGEEKKEEEQEPLYYLDDKQPLPDDAKQLMKNRIIFAVLAKYLYEIYKEINNTADYKKKIDTLYEDINPVYVFLFVMMLKYNFDEVGSFTAFDENDAINKFTGDDVDDRVIRDYCLICVIIIRFIDEQGLSEEEISQLINLTGLLGEQ